MYTDLKYHKLLQYSHISLLYIGGEIPCPWDQKWTPSVITAEIDALQLSLQKYLHLLLSKSSYNIFLFIFFYCFFLYNSSFANCVELLLLLFAIMYDMWGISDSNTIVRVKYAIHFLYEEGYSVELHIFMPFMWKRAFMCE